MRKLIRNAFDQATSSKQPRLPDSSPEVPGKGLSVNSTGWADAQGNLMAWSGALSGGDPDTGVLIVRVNLSRNRLP
jgi:hypothetical protein